MGVQEPSSPQVAITGLGVVCPLGNSLSAALGRARAGASGIRAYTSPWLAPDHPQHHRVGGTVVDFEPDPHLEPRFAARQEPGVLYALAAAAEAMAAAGLADAVDDARDRRRARPARRRGAGDADRGQPRDRVGAITGERGRSRAG